MSKLPKITLSEWAEVMSQSRACNLDTVPKDWKTMAEISDEIGVTQTHARHQLNPLLGTKLERKKFRIIVHGGATRSVYHYHRIK